MSRDITTVAYEHDQCSRRIHKAAQRINRLLAALRECKDDCYTYNIEAESESIRHQLHRARAKQRYNNTQYTALTKELDTCHARIRT